VGETKTIARGGFKNLQVLILDKATSALDNKTEAAIERSLVLTVDQ